MSIIDIASKAIKNTHSLVPDWGTWFLVVLSIISFSIIGILMIICFYTEVIFHKKEFPLLNKIGRILLYILILELFLGSLVYFLIVIFEAVGLISGILALIGFLALVMSSFQILNKIASCKPFNWKAFALWTTVGAISLYCLSLVIGHHVVS